eukprot:GFYU01003593.1.p1 GENE.GFYU01003593.1~~GFYU01003593.1.p1  ORF type:complete len:817 (-),score=223.66 GFYU01003593.1:113-2563(-)
MAGPSQLQQNTSATAPMSASASNGVLAAAGDQGVKIWHVLTGNQTPIKSFTPHTKTANCVRWNHNNQVLVSAGDDGRIVLSHTTGAWLGTLESFKQDAPTTPEEINTLCFSSGSRYLCSGGDDCIVKVWDLKKKERIKSFSGHTDVITAVTFSSNDSHVASGGLSGDILLHSVVNGQTVATLSNKDSQAVKCLQYSPFKRNLLAAAEDDGSVRVWDTNHRSVHTLFNQTHEAPCNAIAFSPVNHLLLSSAGLDKKLLFFDVQEKKTVKVLNTEAPLSSLSFLDDGVTIAAGTTNGKILIFDLRKGSSPSQSFETQFLTGVTSLQFQITKAAPKKPTTGTGIVSASDARASASSEQSMLKKSSSAGALRGEGTDPTAAAKAKGAAGKGETPLVNEMLSGRPHSSSSDFGFSPSTMQRYPSVGDITGQVTQELERKWTAGSVGGSTSGSSVAGSGDFKSIISPIQEGGRPHTAPSQPTPQQSQPMGGSTVFSPPPQQLEQAKENLNMDASPATGAGLAPRKDNQQSVISPLGYSSYTAAKESSVLKPSNNITSPLATDGQNVTPVGPKTTASDLFSPLGPTTGLSHNAVSPADTPAVSGLAASQMQSPLETPLQQSGTHKPAPPIVSPFPTPTVSQQQQSHGAAIVSAATSKLDSITLDSEPKVQERRTSSPRVAKQVAAPAVTPGSGADTTMVSPSPFKAAARSTNQQQLQHTLAMEKVQADYTAQPQAPAGAPQHGTNASQLQEQLLRNIIEESLSSFHKSIHEEVQNLHLELLRQFHLQQTQFESMLETFADRQTALLDEVNRLREENDKLSHLY